MPKRRKNITPAPELNRIELSKLEEPIRKGFETLQKHMLMNMLLHNFKAFEIVFTNTFANFKLRHGFKYIPKDIIQTSKIGAGTVTYNYSSFTADELDITVSGAVTPADPTTIRFMVGTMEVAG